MFQYEFADNLWIRGVVCEFFIECSLNFLDLRIDFPDGCCPGGD